MKTYYSSLLSLLLLSSSFPLFSQSYWQRDFNGAPVKEELILTYKLDKQGKKDQLKDSIITTYYADGTLKESYSSWYVNIDGEELWNYSKEVFHYEAGILTQIDHYYRDNISQVSIVEKNQNKIFPLKRVIFQDALAAHSNGAPLAIAVNQYDRKNNLLHSLLESTGSYKVENIYSYKRNELRELKSLITGHDAEEKENLYRFKTLKENKLGWETRQRTEVEEESIIERSFALYSEEDLQNPDNLYQK